MGRYINKDSKGEFIGSTFSQKRAALIQDNAIMIPPPTKFEENLVCLVDNRFFAAAGYAYSEQEMNKLLNTNGRSFQWFDYPHAKELAK